MEQSEYTVKDGIIKNPGKFEGEPAYVPYFWDMVLDGQGSEDDQGNSYIEFDAEDVKTFPDLEGFDCIALRENNDGFVFHQLHTEAMDNLILF